MLRGNFIIVRENVYKIAYFVKFTHLELIRLFLVYAFECVCVCGRVTKFILVFYQSFL